MEDNPIIPDMPIPNELPREKKEYTKGMVLMAMILGLALGAIIVLGFVQLEISPQWVTDQTATNQTNAAFQYGTEVGFEYAIATITNQSIQCNQIPMNYSGYQYTLIAAECLDLNKDGGK